MTICKQKITENSTKNHEAPSRRPWHKPSVMRIDIKKTLEMEEST
jgi:hypothetical protein